MRTRGPQQLLLGNLVRFNDRVWTVVAFNDGRVHLTDALGDSVCMQADQLVSMPGFEIAESERCHDGEVGDLDVPSAALERARWWERHVLEVITGLPSESHPGAVPEQCYAPRLRSLAERESAKAAELGAQGVLGASARTVRRKRQRYQSYGIKGLLDGRAKRTETPGARQDSRLLEALSYVLAEHSGPRRSADYYRRATGHFLEQWYGPGVVWLPSRSTFHRLINKITAQYGTPSRLPRATPHAALTRPGQRVVVDTMRFPLLTTQESEENQSTQLTAVFDELTHSVYAVLVHTGSSAVNGQGLLARLCTAYPARGSAPACADGSAGARPEPTEALPSAVPECLALDHGSLTRSHPFLAECRRLGISVVRTSPSTKGTGEALLRRLGQQFLARWAESLPAGDSIARKWTLPELQSLAEEVALAWQKQPAEGLRGLVGYGHEPTPQVAHAACVSRSGVLPLPLPASTYPALLPREWRTVTARGILVHGRTYDGYALQRLRSGSSSAAPAKNKVEVRFDPFDARQVWIHGQDGSWATLPATTLPQLSMGSGPGPGKDAGASVRSGHGPGRDSRRRAAAPFPSSPLHARTAAVDTPVTDDLRLTSLEGWRRYVDTATTDGPAGESDWRDNEERLAYHAQLPLLVTPLLQSVEACAQQLLIRNQQLPVGRRSLLVYGPACSGKTTALVAFGRHNELRDSGQHSKSGRRHRIPTAYVSLRPAATARTLLTDLAGFLKLPTRSRQPLADLSGQVRDALLYVGTYVVLIDDLHRMQPATRHTETVVDVLRYLADQLPSVFVYATADENHPLLADGGLGHLPVLRADPFPYGPGWEQAVDSLERMLRLHRHTPGSLAAQSRALHQRTHGRVEVLAHFVRSAAIQAVLDGSEQITGQTLGAIG